MDGYNFATGGKDLGIRVYETKTNKVGNAYSSTKVVIILWPYVELETKDIIIVINIRLFSPKSYLILSPSSAIVSIFYSSSQKSAAQWLYKSVWFSCLYDVVFRFFWTVPRRGSESGTSTNLKKKKRQKEANSFRYMVLSRNAKTLAGRKID